MGPNRRAQERERAAAEAAAKAKRVESERRAVAEAQKIVGIWNARQAGGRALWFYPTKGPRHPRRRNIEPDPFGVLPSMLAQRAVREA
jgi:hypothetical protein